MYDIYTNLSLLSMICCFKKYNKLDFSTITTIYNYILNMSETRGSREHELLTESDRVYMRTLTHADCHFEFSIGIKVTTLVKLFHGNLSTKFHFNPCNGYQEEDLRKSTNHKLQFVPVAMFVDKSAPKE